VRQECFERQWNECFNFLTLPQNLIVVTYAPKLRSDKFLGFFKHFEHFPSINQLFQQFSVKTKWFNISVISEHFDHAKKSKSGTSSSRIFGSSNVYPKSACNRIFSHFARVFQYLKPCWRSHIFDIIESGQWQKKEDFFRKNPFCRF